MSFGIRYLCMGTIFFVAGCASPKKKSLTENLLEPPPLLTLEELTDAPPDYKINIQEALVISLEGHAKSEARLNAMKEQFKDINIPLVHLPGIWGKNYPTRAEPHKLQTLDKNKGWSYIYAPEKARFLAAGEIGCYLSHYECIKKASTAEKPILILEDDAHLSDHFEKRLASALSYAPKDWDMLFLFCFQDNLNWGCSPRRFHATEDRRFLKLDKYCIPGGLSYLVSQKGAKKLTEKLMPIDEPVDNAFGTKFFINEDFKAYCTYPEIVKQDLSKSVIREMGRPF